MRTTITIDDQLFRVFKVRAAELGTTFSSEVESALRRDLDRQRAERTDAEPFVLITAGEGSGGLLPGVDINSNAALQDLLDQGVPLEKLR
jgi:hypothetical protein